MATQARKAVLSVAGIALVFMLAIFATGCGGNAANASKYIAGTYEGEGSGFGGKINVNLTVNDSEITDVEVTHENESDGIPGKTAVEDGTFAEQIKTAQGSDIDGVSGATYTTNGVKEAVDEALEKAANPDYSAE